MEKFNAKYDTVELESTNGGGFLIKRVKKEKEKQKEKENI